MAPTAARSSGEALAHRLRAISLIAFDICLLMLGIVCTIHLFCKSIPQHQATMTEDPAPQSAAASDPVSHEGAITGFGIAPAPPGSSDPDSHGTHTQAQETQAAPQITAQGTTTAPQAKAGNVPPLSQPQAAAEDAATAAIRSAASAMSRKRWDNPKPAQKVPLAYPSQQVAITNPSSNSDLQQNSGIQGLDVIPKSWGELPGNVSLGQEIAWVQANRLYVVKEQAGKPTKVDLSKARAPAPSAAALSWLETSIRSYAKFVEVAAKTASAGTEDQEEDRQERMQIEEIRTLLKQMID